MAGGPAYIEAGYKVSPPVAKANACRLLTNANVAGRIKELRANASEQSDFKRADLVRFLVAVLQTPIGQLDANSPLVQEITTDAIGEATVRKRVRMMGKIECARLLVDIMGWKAPEQVVVESGPKALDAIKERAERVASALDLRARMREAAQGANAMGHSNGSALSRWPRRNPESPVNPGASR